MNDQFGKDILILVFPRSLFQRVSCLERVDVSTHLWADLYLTGVTKKTVDCVNVT